MADENFGIIVEIDPRPALAGTTQVDRALEKNEQSARDFEREAKAAMADICPDGFCDVQLTGTLEVAPATFYLSMTDVVLAPAAD